MSLERLADVLSDLYAAGLWLMLAVIMTAAVFSPAPFGPAVVVYAGVASWAWVAVYHRFRRVFAPGNRP